VTTQPPDMQPPDMQPPDMQPPDPWLPDMPRLRSSAVPRLFGREPAAASLLRAVP
jgi:hypothetical protein